MEINLLLKLQARPDTLDPSKPSQFATIDQALMDTMKALNSWWTVTSAAAHASEGDMKAAYDTGYKTGLATSVAAMASPDA